LKTGNPVFGLKIDSFFDNRFLNLFLSRKLHKNYHMSDFQQLKPVYQKQWF